MKDDLLHMRAALALARRGLGNAWPNPAVGCVLVKEGRVIGRGWTQPGGRPHAETEALRRAGDAARGATAYVTLEPCSHHGRTPPCCEALAEAGITRVVMAMRDPDPRVNGRGLAMLRGAGIAVEEGLLEAEARALNAGFFRRIQAGMPVVTLKLASTLDGRIATASGESRWITGAAARREVHALRARHDAILVGSGTVLADDPDLTDSGDGAGADAARGGGCPAAHATQRPFGAKRGRGAGADHHRARPSAGGAGPLHGSWCGYCDRAGPCGWRA
jgi:diaminohydroxyphosphoribosylaminopyrimidine deaminase/5-amino-6-(5-phosphoribosylamino)uracil reductase